MGRGRGHLVDQGTGSSNAVLAAEFEMNVGLFDAHGSMREEGKVVNKQGRTRGRGFVQCAMDDGFGLATDVKGGSLLGAGAVSRDNFTLLLPWLVAGAKICFSRLVVLLARVTPEKQSGTVVPRAEMPTDLPPAQQVSVPAGTA